MYVYDKIIPVECWCECWEEGVSCALGHEGDHNCDQEGAQHCPQQHHPPA